MKKTFFILLSAVLLSSCSMAEKNADIMMDASQKKADKLTDNIMDNVQKQQNAVEEALDIAGHDDFGLKIISVNNQDMVRYQNKNFNLEFSLPTDCHYWKQFSSEDYNDFSCINISATLNKSQEAPSISNKNEFCEFLCQSWGFKGEAPCIDGRKSDIDRVEKVNINGREFIYTLEATGVGGVQGNHLYLITKDYVYKFTSKTDLSKVSEEEVIKKDRLSLSEIIENSNLKIISQ